MHPIFMYLIQVNISLAIFYLLYAIVLRGDTFLRLRRIYFLSVIIFSLFYPFFTMPFLSDIWISRPSGLEGAAATIIMGGSGRAMVSEGGVSMPMAVSWEKILSLSYITITLGVILRFIFQLLSIYGIWLKSEKQKIGRASCRERV